MHTSGQPINLQEAHARYAALVDKKFASGLSETEQAELQYLEGYLNKAEAELYEPIKDKLRAALGATAKA